MEKIKLYCIDTDYIKYLYEVDNRVMFWNADHYKRKRKYVGVVLSVNNFEYFAPLSSSK